MERVAWSMTTGPSTSVYPKHHAHPRGLLLRARFRVGTGITLRTTYAPVVAVLLLPALSVPATLRRRRRARN
jgi:hypothetical protein